MRLKVIYRCVFDIFLLDAPLLVLPEMTANNGAAPLMLATMPLPRGLLQKLKSLVIANGINGELQAAFNYVGQLGHIQPTGKRAAVRNFDNVKSNTENQSGGVLFGGSLSQMALQQRAMSTIDIGKLGYIMENATTDASLREMIKPIIVNIDAGSAVLFTEARL